MGGFSPDGVSGLFPTDFAKYFRLHATLPTGQTVILNETGKNYQIGNVGQVKIFGLADLGHKQDSYDLCYFDDHDNQIDICLAGDEAAIRLITGLEIPVGNSTADPTGQYNGLYNPGGPGNDPTPGVNYTLPCGYQLQSVKMALDNPWVVSYNSTTGTGTGTYARPVYWNSVRARVEACFCILALFYMVSLLLM